MSECCNQTESALQKIARRQTSTLKIVLGIILLVRMGGWFWGNKSEI